jgi:hypothetical protein
VYLNPTASNLFLYLHLEKLKVKGKGKVVPVLNWAPCHEGVLAERKYRSKHSLTSALDGGGQLPGLGRLNPTKRAGGTHWYPLDRRLGGPQSRSGRGGEEKSSFDARFITLCHNAKDFYLRNYYLHHVISHWVHLSLCIFLSKHGQLYQIYHCYFRYFLRVYVSVLSTISHTKI